LSFDSRGALLAYIYNNEDHKWDNKEENL
jgi:hypothetical protein